MKRTTISLVLTIFMAQSFSVNAARVVSNMGTEEQAGNLLAEFKTAVTANNLNGIHQTVSTGEIPESELGLALCKAVFYQKLAVVNALLAYKHLMNPADIQAAHVSAVNQELWGLADLLLQ
jgi:hypothetical protein